MTSMSFECALVKIDLRHFGRKEGSTIPFRAKYHVVWKLHNQESVNFRSFGPGFPNWETRWCGTGDTRLACAGRVRDSSEVRTCKRKEEKGKDGGL
jgi:hypothetical protein